MTWAAQQAAKPNSILNRHLTNQPGGASDGTQVKLESLSQSNFWNNV